MQLWQLLLNSFLKVKKKNLTSQQRNNHVHFLVHFQLLFHLVPTHRFIVDNTTDSTTCTCEVMVKCV